jgi:flagellar motor switch protein FliG
MLKSIEKAAILLNYVGDDAVQSIMGHLKSEYVERLSVVMRSMEEISPDVAHDVLQEFLRENNLARPAMRAQFTTERANKYLQQMQEQEEEEEEEVDLQTFLQKADHKQLIELIKNEHPQVIAFILSYIPTDISGQILPLLPAEVQASTALRIATMGTPQKDMIKHLNRMLGNKIKLLTSKTMQVGGVPSLVKILRGAGRNSERIILEHFQEEKPELAVEIKKLMLVFEDLVLLDDISIQKVLRDIDSKILARALKKTTPEIKELLMKNLSERARNILKEEIETLGMTPLKDVEKAQQQIIEVVRQLEEKGEISINKEKEELV